MDSKNWNASMMAEFKSIEKEVGKVSFAREREGERKTERTEHVELPILA